MRSAGVLGFSSTSLPRDKLTKALRAYETKIGDNFKDSLPKYNKDVRNVLLDATQDSEQNYFARHQACLRCLQGWVRERCHQAQHRAHQSPSLANRQQVSIGKDGERHL